MHLCASPVAPERPCIDDGGVVSSRTYLTGTHGSSRLALAAQCRPGRWRYFRAEALVVISIDGGAEGDALKHQSVWPPPSAHPRDPPAS